MLIWPADKKQGKKWSPTGSVPPSFRALPFEVQNPLNSPCPQRAASWLSW